MVLRLETGHGEEIFQPRGPESDPWLVHPLLEPGMADRDQDVGSVVDESYIQESNDSAVDFAENTVNLTRKQIRDIVNRNTGKVAGGNERLGLAGRFTNAAHSAFSLQRAFLDTFRPAVYVARRFAASLQDFVGFDRQLVPHVKQEH